MTPILLALLACASRAPTFPGPLGPVAKSRPDPIDVRDLPPVEEHTEPAPAPKAVPVAKKPRRSGFGDEVAKAAQHYLQRSPNGFRNDCSGFVMAAYDRAGKPISGSSKTLWEDAKAQGGVHHSKRPRLGDIAFFDNTYDRNKNGRRDDPLTHVAIVIDIDDNGTITLAHAGTSKGRTTMKMNLHHPELRKGPDGSVYNDWLRARKKGEPEKGKYFSGQLFKGFGALDARS